MPRARPARPGRGTGAPADRYSPRVSPADPAIPPNPAPGLAAGDGREPDPAVAAEPPAGRGPVPDPDPVPGEAPAGPRLPPFVREIAQTLLLTVAVFLGLQAFIAQPYQIFQESMERTLLPGQFVVVDKLSPRWDPYRRGDIVVFLAPSEPGGGEDAPFIKRVIGLPGDTVELDDGTVYVNGRALVEPYVYRDENGAQPTLITGVESAWDLGDDEVFVLGDHRGASEDSRVFGPVPLESVLGRAVFRYWPPTAVGPIVAPEYPGFLSERT